MIKHIILSDLDGTLLSSNEQFNLETIEYIKQLIEKRKDILFCFVTGRCYQKAKDFYKQLGLKSYLFTCNGAYVYHPKQTWSFPFSWTLIKNIVAVLSWEQINKFEISAEEFLFTFKNEADYQKFISSPEMLKTPPTNFSIYFNSKVKNIDSIIRKIKDSNTEIINKFFLFFQNYSNKNYYQIEFNNNNIDKSFSAKFLSQKYNIPMSQIYSFGDNINDLEMLAATGKSYAMSNALLLVKTIAKNITEYSNNENGVVKELQKLFPL